MFGVMIDAETFRHIIDFTVASVGDSVDISPCIICPDVLLLEQHVFFPSRVRNDDLTRCSGQTLNIWFKMDEKKKKRRALSSERHQDIYGKQVDPAKSNL